ncbi:MAG: hypothetical protein Q8J62_10060, partial [Candidatus Cloacimonadaceae bacterium]|nr:hypothetical protein [Candidatus Cloacimonadaceae bacterium]
MFLFFAMIYGTLIGFVRIAQGGHFASDVIWSGALIYLCSYILFRAMRMHRGVFYEPQLVKAHTALKLYQKAALIVLAVVVAAGVSLATP